MEAGDGEHGDWWQGTQFRLMAWTVDQLEPRHQAWMRALPSTLEIGNVPGGAFLCHGSPVHLREQIYIRAQADSALGKIRGKWLLCGHTHNARMYSFHGRCMINPGSLGLALDGIGGVASYALLDEGKELGEVGSVRFRQVTYDVGRVVRDMEKNRFFQLAPGFARAVKLELLNGRKYVSGLFDFYEKYARKQGLASMEIIPALWEEAEKLWDGGERMKSRMV